VTKSRSVSRPSSVPQSRRQTQVSSRNAGH
jgi:hypothetical protein